ncbi:hypothetical protein EVAR_77882_1 [Eumeta japonica]|uniref:Uncharacterized protein n=1 Tax=Eumeta variegata TaxID=151549 RepID=A0A4C1TCD2_EUMVA|nr:hypothetical protein EVAR_77882_1 [Eumeta japonica]
MERNTPTMKLCIPSPHSAQMRHAVAGNLHTCAAPPAPPAPPAGPLPCTRLILLDDRPPPNAPPAPPRPATSRLTGN